MPDIETSTEANDFISRWLTASAPQPRQLAPIQPSTVHLTVYTPTPENYRLVNVETNEVWQWDLRRSYWTRAHDVAVERAT